MRALPASAILLMLLFARGDSAYSYTVNGQSWSGGTAYFSVNANFPSSAGSDDEVIAAIRCGADAWHQQGEADFRFVYAGTTSVSSINEFDGTNSVFCTSETGGGGVLAATWYGYDAFDNIIGFDVVYFSENDFGTVAWNAAGDTDASSFDLTSTATHELGHALGLGHSADSDATMYAYYNGISGRTLTSDDIDGVQDIYGFASHANPDPLIEAVEPGAGPLEGGDEVTISGENFTWESDTELTVDGDVLDPSEYVVVNCCTIVIFSMPARSAAGEVDIEVANELGSDTFPGGFVYEEDVPPQTIVSVVPNAGPVAGGTAITIFGDDFAEDATVTIGGKSLVDLAVESSKRITGTAPAGAREGFVDVVVTQDSDSVAFPDGFFYSTDVISLESITYPAGTKGAEVRVYTSSEHDLDGFSLGVDFDSTHLTATDVTTEDTWAEDAAFVGAQQNNEAEPAGGFWTLGVLMDLSDPLDEVIPAGEGREVAVARYDIANGLAAGAVLPLTIEPRGDPVVLVRFAHSDLDVSPASGDGAIEIGGYTFVRGDANGDALTGLGDAVIILAFMFTSGPLACADRADIDDSGSLTIADPMRLLRYLFTAGTPPAEPFPEPGPDPTRDGLLCEE